jgi:CRP-like cAMP-binding protein
MQHSLTGESVFNPHQFCRRLRACLPNYTNVLHLLAKEALYTCGARDSNVYIIESGCVKILTLCKDGKECLLDVCTQGDIIGESCMLNTERAETVVTMNPSVIRTMTRAQFMDTILKYGLFEDALQYLAFKLAQQQQVITHFVTTDSERRLANALLRLGRKLGKRQDGKLYIDDKITTEELAEIVGTTRSRVGYFLKRFRSSRLIEGTTKSFLLINERLLDDYVQHWA